MGNAIAKDRLLVGIKSWNDSSVPPTCQLMNYCRRTHTWRFHREDSSSSSSSLFMSFPQLEDAEIRCSKYGWLLMSRSDSTLFFFNPWSNRTIELRPEIGYGYTTLFFTHPPTSRECTVVGIRTPPYVGKFVVEICVLAARGGKNGTEWKTHKHPTKTKFSLSSGPPIMHRGRIYFLDARGNVAMFNINNRRLVTTEKCLISQQDDKIKEHYLFELNCGYQVFGVFVFHDKGKVKVFRLSTRKTKTKKTKMRWEKVDDIGDNVVYLSRVSSLSFPCSTKSCMANRIYFPRLHACDSLVFYSLSDAKFHSADDLDETTDNNDPDAKLEHAAWVQLTATTNFQTSCWKLILFFLYLVSVSGFLTIIQKFRK